MTGPYERTLVDEVVVIVIPEVSEVPKVPSDVINPNMTRPIFAIFPIRSKSCLFNPRLFAILIIKNCEKIPLSQKNRILKC